MLESLCRHEIGRRVSILQQFVVMNVVGFAAFLGIMTFAFGAPAEGMVGRLLTYTAVGLAMVGVAARLILPRRIVARGRQSIVDGTRRPPHLEGEGDAKEAQPPDRAQSPELAGDAERLFSVLQKKTYAAVAVLSIPAHVAAMWYGMARSPIVLIVAIALIVCVAAHFPTRGKVFHWIEDQLRLVEQERVSGR